MVNHTHKDDQYNLGQTTTFLRTLAVRSERNLRVATATPATIDISSTDSLCGQDGNDQSLIRSWEDCVFIGGNSGISHRYIAVQSVVGCGFQ